MPRAPGSPLSAATFRGPTVFSRIVNISGQARLAGDFDAQSDSIIGWPCIARRRRGGRREAMSLQRAAQCRPRMPPA